MTTRTQEHPVRLIAYTAFYEISIHTGKNRIYLKVKNNWNNSPGERDYLVHWKEALAQVKPGFTVSTDARQLTSFPKLVRDIHEQAQLMVVEAGVSHVAEVLPLDHIVHVQADRISYDTGMPKGKFTTPEQAEAWLDSL